MLALREPPILRITMAAVALLYRQLSREWHFQHPVLPLPSRLQ